MLKVMLVGASGLIGSEVMAHSGSHQLHILSRSGVGAAPRNIEYVDKPSRWSDIIAKAAPDVLVSCLGTTRSKAGSKEAFTAVDRDLVLAVATAAKKAGATQMIAVSSVGANSKSSNFYLSVKGEAEDGLRALGFDRLDIMRPGLLRGDRQEDRPTERLAQMFAPLTDMLTPSSWSRYRSIGADQVARAIVALVKQGGTGNFIHENDAMAALAD